MMGWAVRAFGRVRVGFALTVLTLFAFLLASRLPFLSNTLVGEEGSIAAYVLSPEPLSQKSRNGLPYALIGQIDGAPILAPPERTIIPYIIIEKIGRILTSQQPQPTDGARSRAARLPFLLMFMMGVAGLLAMLANAIGAAEHRRVVVAGLTVLYGLTTPLAMGASIQPQLDGSIGVLLLGLAGWLLTSAQATGVRIPAFAAAGVLIGLGRHEWAMVFGLAAALLLVFDLIVRGNAVRAYLAALLGIAAGVAISLAVSNQDYMMGFGLMRRIYYRDGVNLAQILSSQISFVLPVVALLVAASIALLRGGLTSIAARCGTALILIGAIGILVGFMASGWPGDGFPRYYAPSLVLATYALVGIVLEGRKLVPDRVLPIGAIVLAIGIAWNGVQLGRSRAANVSISSAPGMALGPLQERLSKGATAAAGGGVLFEQASVWVYSPTASFISSDMGWEGALNLLARRFPAHKDKLLKR